jgi:hypothetical protein
VVAIAASKFNYEVRHDDETKELGEYGMKSNEKKSDRDRSISNEALAQELKNARSHFEVSSNALFALAEQIASFPDLRLQAVEILRALRRQAFNGEIRGVEKRRLYRTLAALRTYCRAVAGEEEPVDIVESVTALEDHLAELNKMAKRIEAVQFKKENGATP